MYLCHANSHIRSTNKRPNSGNVYGLAESPDGNLLASVTSLGEISIWDLNDFTLLSSIRDKNVCRTRANLLCCVCASCLGSDA